MPLKESSAPKVQILLTRLGFGESPRWHEGRLWFSNWGMIVAESYGKRLTAFDIAADGSLSNRRVWTDLDGGVPDGICLDADNAVWYGDVPNKRCVRVREGGEVLQTINLDRGCFACTLGGADKRTLFLMAAEWHGFAKMADGAQTGQVLTVEATARGVGWP